MRIGELAQQLQVSTSIIRYYEGQGLIPEAGRDSLGYRDYDQADLNRIGLVVGARKLRIPFADIKEILAIQDKGQAPSPRILELLSEKAVDVEQRSSLLESLRLELCRLRGLALRQNHFDSAP